MTNTTKGNLTAAVNAILAMLVGVGVLDLSNEQIGLIVGAVNAVALVVISLTYKSSPKRIPDPEAPQEDG